MNRLLFAMTCAAGLCAGAAPVYTVTLPSGATNTLDEAFSNGYVTSDDDQETPSYDGLRAAADLRVKGGGRLEINKDLKSAGYTGEVHVVAGAILRITANGALGDTAHGTFVEDGATLENECLDMSADNKLDFKDECLAFAGTGVGGLGALIARTPYDGKGYGKERNGVWGGTKLTMTGDAMISTVAGYQDFPNNSNGNSLNMNGHTLTVRGFDTAGDNTLGGVCLRPVITNPGHIVITNCGASINDSANLGGDANNTFTLAANSTLELFSYTTVGKKKWTLSIPASNTRQDVLKSSQVGGVWDGPILADRSLTMGLGTAAGKTNHTAFLDKVTVTGDFVVKNTNKEISVPTLALASDENAFSGAFSVEELVTLKVDSAAALACATATVAATSSIVLNPEVTDYRLPVVVIKGESSIVSGGGRCEGLIKDGAGDLAYENLLDISNLVLNAGSMTYSPLANDAVFYAGLSYGMDTNFESWSGAEDINRQSNQAYYNENIAAPTNKVVLDFSDIKPNKDLSRSLPGGSGTYYDGYLWNPDATNVTWRFASCVSTITWLKINGKKVISKQGSGEIAFCNATLTPGANRLIYHIGSMGDAYTYVPSNCATWTNGYAFAYSTTSTTSEDSADFRPLADPGDGSVLRCAIEGTDHWSERAAAWSNAVAMAAMVSTRFAGSAGTTLNLANRALRTAKLEGCPTVTKAEAAHFPESVEVTENWTVDGADLAAGGQLACEQTIVFAEGSTVSIMNGRALAKPGKVAIAVSDEAIVGLPTFLAVDRYQFEITKSDDGKTLYAEYVPRGMIILFR